MMPGIMLKFPHDIYNALGITCMDVLLYHELSTYPYPIRARMHYELTM